MSLIDEKSNNSNSSRYYHVDGISNTYEAVEWICSLIKSKTIEPIYISLSDLVNRSDEGSGNAQLDPTATHDIIMHELENKNIDIISVIGRFMEMPIVIGVDLRNTQCFITARKSKLIDFKAIEKKLNLCDDAMTDSIVLRPTKKSASSQSVVAEQLADSQRSRNNKRTACYYGRGRQDAIVASVVVHENGTGSITINGSDIDEYFGHEIPKQIVRQPLIITGTIGKVDVVCTVRRGGMIGQARAIRHGVSSALLEVNPEFRARLKEAGFLTRDQKQEERQIAARRNMQFKKR